MSLLGNALEAMATCDVRWQSVRAEVARRVDREVEAAACEAERASHGHPSPATPPGVPWPADDRPVRDERRGLLVAVPDALRVEYPAIESVTVVREGQWRRRRPDGQVVGEPRSERIPDLLPMQVSEVTLVRPWTVLAYLRLTGVEQVDREGRAATRLRGVPRPSQWRLFRFPVAPGDRYDLVVDDAAGLLVDLVAWFGDREVVRHTLHNVRLDDPVDPDAFDPDAIGPVGEDTSTAVVPRPLAALVAEVDFTLLQPAGEIYLGYLEPRDGPVVAAHPPGPRPPGQRLWMRQSQGAGMADPTDWDTITLADGTSAGWWSPESDPEQAHLRFEKAGTQIWIQARGTTDIRELAVRLQPLQPLQPVEP